MTTIFKYIFLIWPICPIKKLFDWNFFWSRGQRIDTDVHLAQREISDWNSSPRNQISGHRRDRRCRSQSLQSDSGWNWWDTIGSWRMHLQRISEKRTECSSGTNRRMPGGQVIWCNYKLSMSYSFKDLKQRSLAKCFLYFNVM